MAIAALTTEVAALRREHEAQAQGFRKELADVKDELRNAKRALFGFILTLLGGMIIFLLSISAGWLGSEGAIIVLRWLWGGG